MKSFLQNYNVEICSTHNEGKSIVAERFIRNLKNKLYNYMASISKNVYTDKLYNILNKYNNTYYKTIKMKPLDVNKSFYIDFNKENNKEDPKFKVGNHVRISKYKNIFAESYVPNRYEEAFSIKKVEYNVLCTYVISDRNGEEIAGTFYEKESQKNESKSNKKGDKLYVNWKGCNNSLSSWIDKKDII